MSDHELSSKKESRTSLWKKLCVGAAAIAATTGLAACGANNAGAEKPPTVATASATPGASETASTSPSVSTSETIPTAENTLNLELLRKYEVTVDQYPTVKDAAIALIGNTAEQKGTLSDVMQGVWNAYAANKWYDAPKFPKEAVVALFGPEPEEGYPDDIQSQITTFSEGYDNFANMAAATANEEESRRFGCAETFEPTTPGSMENGIRGKWQQICSDIAFLGKEGYNESTDYDWVSYLNIHLAQRTDETTGNKVWYIDEFRPGETIVK